MSTNDPNIGQNVVPAGETWAGDHLSLCSVMYPGEREPCALGTAAAVEGGDSVSWKERRISLAWLVLLQKGGFSSEGRGNETEKCLPLSKKDREPCIIVLSAGASRSGFASSPASRQRLEGAVAQRTHVLLRDTCPRVGGRPQMSPTPWPQAAPSCHPALLGPAPGSAWLQAFLGDAPSSSFPVSFAKSPGRSG